MDVTHISRCLRNIHLPSIGVSLAIYMQKKLLRPAISHTQEKKAADGSVCVAHKYNSPQKILMGRNFKIDD